MKLPKDRVPYSAIVDRPPLTLPNGARLAVWTIVNVEEWSIERNMPRTVLSAAVWPAAACRTCRTGRGTSTACASGFWRFLEVLQKFDVKATLAINGSVCKSYPRVAEGRA